MEIQQLKALIKETMREVLKEERLLCKILIPYVSDEEQCELEDEFGVSSLYADDEVVDSKDIEVYVIGTRGDVYKNN
jgi:hypothetical protein